MLVMLVILLVGVVVWHVRHSSFVVRVLAGVRPFVVFSTVVMLVMFVILLVGVVVWRVCCSLFTFLWVSTRSLLYLVLGWC